MTNPLNSPAVAQRVPASAQGTLDSAQSFSMRDMLTLRRPGSLTNTWVIALALLSCLCVPRALALDPNKGFEHYVGNLWSIQDGLPQITATAITQDGQGYIWVGTQGGLARFDGVRFVSFTPETAPGLPGIFIRTVFTDHQGQLWIGTYKGLARYIDGRFESIGVSNPNAHPTLDVNAIAETADGTMVVATAEGVFRVINDKLVAMPNSPKPSLSLLARKDGLWVGSTGAVFRLRGNQAERLAFPDNASDAAIGHLIDAQQRIWAGTSQGLYSLIDGTWQRFEEDTSLQSSPIGTLLHDHDSNLWVSTNTGLARLRNAHLAEWVDASNPRAIPNIVSAFEDREGNVWFGSQLEGLARIWNGWTHRYSVHNGLNDRTVWSVSPGEDGAIWVGTNDGVSYFRNGRFSLVLPGDSLPHPHGYNLFYESGQLWIGTRRGLVIWKDGKLEVPPLYAPMTGIQINGIFRDSDGSMWFTSTDGLYHQTGDQLRRYGVTDGLKDPRVRVILKTHNGRYLLGTQGGLYELRHDHAEPLDQKTGLSPNLDITALLELPSGALVAGTLSEQLFLYEAGKWFDLGPQEGVPRNAAFFMSMDDRNFLWIAGIRGVGRIPVQDFSRFARGQIKALRGEMLLNERGDRNAGQQGFCCNGAGMSKGFLAGHVLWLPSRDGVVALDTHGITKNKITAAPLIERIRYLGTWHRVNAGDVNGKDVAHAARSTGTALAETKPAALKLEPKARDITIQFTAPSFQDPRSVQLRYRLIGYDDQWHDLDDVMRRTVSYTNLPPGDYTFEVRAANNAGIWDPQVARLPFGIRPWFYETRMFYLLIGLLLTALLYAIYRRQRLAHVAQRRLLEQEVRERTRQLHAANERLENSSQTDPLTGLRNRRFLANQLPADLAYYDREQLRSGDYDQAILFALVDIDQFQHVNDLHGQKAGDRALQQLAQLLQSLVRGGDFVVRWGGEEFLLVLRPMPMRNVEVIGERLRAAVAAHVFDIGAGLQMRLTCSIGFAEYPLFRDAARRLGWEQMVELAAAASQWVKSNGRDGWAAFRPTALTDLAALTRDLHIDPHKLIAQGQLQVRSGSGPGDVEHSQG